MAKISSFRELEVWQMAMELVIDCYTATERLPAGERFGLVREIRRSAVSIPSNIAEGHNRHSTNAYLNHVNIALGSHAELDCQLEIAVRLNYLRSSDLVEVVERVTRVGQMLHGLQRSLDSHKRDVMRLALLTAVLGGLLLS